MTTPVRPTLPWSLRLLTALLGVTPDDERTFEAQRAELENRAHALHDMSILDAKSSALLTHVSLMLAVVAVLLAQPNGALWRWIYTAELVAFSGVGVALLRCIDVMGPPFRRLPPNPAGGLEEHYRVEVMVRRAIFQVTLRAVRLLTLALILMVGARGFL